MSGNHQSVKSLRSVCKVLCSPLRDCGYTDLTVALEKDAVLREDRRSLSDGEEPVGRGKALISTHD